MPFAFVTQTIQGNNAGNFDFSSFNAGSIGAFVYGLTEFYLVNGSPGAEIQNFALDFTVSPGTGVGYSTVTLQPQVSSDMYIDGCWATVTVMAWLGGDTPEGIYLGNTTTNVGVAAQPIEIGFPPLYSCGVLAGFNLSFASDSSDLLGIGAGSGVACTPYNGSTSYISPITSGVLTGDSAFSGSVNTGIICFTAPPSGLTFQMGTTVSPNGAVEMPAPDGVTDIWVFLQAFYAQFDIDTDPTPDLVSLQVGVTEVGVSVWDNEVGVMVTVDFQGLIYYNSTRYGGGVSMPASMQDATTTFLVVMTS